MKSFKFLRALTVVAVALSLTACATSKPVGQWRNPEFNDKLNNILIIGVASRSTRRRVFEDSFVDALAAYEVEAIPSYTLITSTLKLSRQTVEEAIRGKNLDAVLVTRLAGIRDKDVYERPDEKSENMTFFTYYDSLEQTSSGNAAQYRVITLETNVYETGSGGLVWSMQSEVVEPSRPRTAIVDQIQLTIDSLKSQGLIGN